jgi:glucose-6-phosphate 1-dehydrogenase
MHVNTDEDDFVKKMTYTSGNVHDSKEFDKLLGINKHEHKPSLPLRLRDCLASMTVASIMLIEPRETIMLFCSK